MPIIFKPVNGGVPFVKFVYTVLDPLTRMFISDQRKNMIFLIYKKCEQDHVVRDL